MPELHLLIHNRFIKFHEVRINSEMQITSNCSLEWIYVANVEIRGWFSAGTLFI